MDPHASEAAAAVQGMAEIYGRHFSPSRVVLRDGRPVDTWSAGDWVSFTDQDGNTRAGHIIEVLDDSGYGIYHVAAHRIGGGRDHYSVDGFSIHVF